MEMALRAETQTRLCESERRKTSNCLSRRRVFDVQRTSTFSGSAWNISLDFLLLRFLVSRQENEVGLGKAQEKHSIHEP